MLANTGPPQAQFLPRFDNILVVNNGMIAHSGTYDELLASGTLDDQVLSRVAAPKAAATSAADAVEVTSDGKVVLKNAPLDKAETQAERAPSEWGVYAYFLQSCGIAGIVLFFALAAILAGERSFESAFYPAFVPTANLYQKTTDGRAQLSGSRCGLRTRKARSVFTWVFLRRSSSAASPFLGESACRLPCREDTWNYVLMLICNPLTRFFFDVLLPASSLRLYFGQLETLMK